jgi:hypothetical protein
VKKMENKRVAILVLAIAAALVIASTATYAMMARQTSGTGNPYGSTTNGYGVGRSMMGGSTGYAGGMMGGSSGRAGGMMGGYGMMGAWNGTSSMYERMQQMHDYMQQYWNSTAP